MEDVEAEAVPTHIIIPLRVIQQATQVMYWKANIDLNANAGENKKDFLYRNGIPTAMKEDPDGCQLYLRCDNEIKDIKDEDMFNMSLANKDVQLLLVDSLTNVRTQKLKLGPLGLKAKT